jgi:hypothetical protein
MLKKSFVLIPVLALLALAYPAHAETSAAKKELVAKVLKLQQPSIENMARGLAEQPAAQLMQQAGLALQNKVAADKREAVAKEIQADVKKYVDETVPIVRERAITLAPSTVGAVLEEKMSDAELKQIIGVLKSMETPVFRKFQQLGGDMQRALVEKLVADTRPMVEPKVKALEQSIANRLGIPAQPAPAASAAK